MMSIAAARALTDVTACFVGIGLPSTGANLARAHARAGPRARLRGGHDRRQAAAAAAVDRRRHARRDRRLQSSPSRRSSTTGCSPAGSTSASSAPRRSTASPTSTRRSSATTRIRRSACPAPAARRRSPRRCGEVIVIVRQSTRAFVEKVDFITSVGHGDGPGDREKLGLRGKGPTKVITDLGILEPDPETRELVLTHVHPGVTAEQAREATGWELKVADDLATTEPPTDEELAALRELVARMTDAYILDAVRTPFGRYGGALAGVRPDDLGAHVVQARSSSARPSSTRRDRRRDLRQRQRRGRGQPQRRAHGRAARRAADQRPGRHGQPPVRLEPRRGDPGRAARSRPATPTLILVGGVESMSRAPWVCSSPSKGFPAGHETMHSTTLGWRMVNPEMPDAVDDLARRERREAGRDLRDRPRGAGRVRAAQPPERRRGLGRRLLRRLGRPGRRTRAGARRGHPRRHVAGEARQAQAGVREGRHGDRGQRLAAQRRRGGAC